MTGRELYARLRVVGEVYLTPEEAGIVATARRLAKADGLRVVTSRESLQRGMSRHQARTRPITVSLTDQGHDEIIRPDAPVPNRSTP
jgi:hypothetical protein